MNTRKTTIAEIYAGLPDAKDAILYEGMEQFLDAYVIPPDFNLQGLINGNKCFITGNKGSGKTAALRYLAYRLKNNYGNARSSFLLFSQDYSEQQKSSMERQMVIHMAVDSASETDVEDFSDLWRWHLFQIIMRDNEVEKKDRIFVHDETWRKFCHIINGILSPEYKAKVSGNINMELPLFNIFTASITLDLPEWEFGKKKLSFSEAIKAATECFLELDRRSCPYYLFIDELDVCYNDKPVYQRDLRLIRDLICQTRYFNSIFQQNGWHQTKFFCTVRPEVLHAIDRTLSAGTVLKQLSGFDCPLSWDVPGAKTFERPVMQLLLKRIEMAESVNGEAYGSEKERYQRWFPESIDHLEPSDYIKTITWSKPRDIVRILDCAKNICQNRSAFTASVFTAIQKQYSAQSCRELTGELEAVYSAREISRILDALRGWKTDFSLDEFSVRLKKYGGTPPTDTSCFETARNLYRAGVFGLFQPAAGLYRWNHLEGTEFLLNDDWKLVVHRGLWEALALSLPCENSEEESPQSTDAENPERLFRELLQIADNMTLTLQQLSPQKRQEPFARGMAIVHQKLAASLKSCSADSESFVMGGGDKL